MTSSQRYPCWISGGIVNRIQNGLLRRLFLRVGVSQRRVCIAVDQNRGTQSHELVRSPQET
jgi:hypothetical protein